MPFNAKKFSITRVWGLLTYLKNFSLKEWWCVNGMPISRYIPAFLSTLCKTRSNTAMRFYTCHGCTVVIETIH